MVKNTNQHSLSNLLLSAALAALLSGCSYLTGSVASRGNAAQSPGAIAQATPIPRVQNCAVLFTGTPSRFACNGKVYTSYQLAKIREDQAKKYAAGN